MLQNPGMPTNQPDRHGPEVPKFVFMAVCFEVCFETHCHAKSLARFITISVGSPSTYILLKFKKLNLSPSQQDPNWALIRTMAGLLPLTASPAGLFAAASLGIRRTELFPSDSFRVKEQGLVILYHSIILKSLGCLTFPPG